MRLLLVAALAFGSTVVLRRGVLDPQSEARRASRLDEDSLISPGPTLLAMGSMEHRHLWSDLFWLSLVQDLADSADATSAGWDRVQRWADIATDLDDKYLTVYHSAAVHLTVYARRPDASDALCKKGWDAMPHEWRLPMLMGYNAYFVRGDAHAAAGLFRAACELPGGPRYLCALAARAQWHSGDERGAIAMLEEILPRLEGPQRDDAEFRLRSLRSEPRLRKFDEACKRYRAETGRHPDSAMQLVTLSYVIDEPPVDLHGKAIELDEECVARTEDIKTREFEAQKRVGKVGTGTTTP